MADLKDKTTPKRVKKGEFMINIVKNLNFAQVVGLTREVLFAVEPVPYRL